MRRRLWLIATLCVASGGAAAGQEPPKDPPPTVVEPAPASLAEPAKPSTPEPTTTSTAGPAPTPGAQAPGVPAHGPTAPLTGSSPPTDVTIDKGTHVTVGIGFGGPIGAAANLRLLHGLGAKVREGDDRVKAVCAVPIAYCARGFLLEAAAGSGGGKLSLGTGVRARVDDEDFHGTVGVGLRAALVRTWGAPLGTEPGLTYLGPELDLEVMRFSLTLGFQWRLGGSTGPSSLFAWGLGFGL